MTRHYCTYFDRKYLTRGLALIESLRRTESSDWEIFVVCMDEMTHVVLRALALPNVCLIPFHEIEVRDTDLLAVKPTRSVVEYYWTATPTVILRILERNRHVKVLSYVDADLFFFSSPQPIFDELGSCSILIHEHRFSPAQAYLGIDNGTYNVGLLSFARTETSFEALRWWRARCLEWCFARSENGKMGDQMYLNDWPERFRDVVVLAHCGGGVGPWNHDQYRFRKDDKGVPWVNEVSAIFYHFHSFTQVNAAVVLPVKHPQYPLPWEALTLFFLPYLEALEQAAQQVSAVCPQGAWHLSPEQTVTPQHTVLIRRAKMRDPESVQLPQERITLNHEWDCWCSNQVLGRPSSSGSLQPDKTSTTGASLNQSHGAAKPVGSSEERRLEASLRRPTLQDDPGQLCANVALLAQICARLSAELTEAGSDPARLSQVLINWMKEYATDPILGPLIKQLQQRDPRLVAFLPQRLQLAMGYFTRPLHDLIDWLGASNETTNLTYELTPSNQLQLAWMVSAVTSTPFPVIRGFLDELEQDVALKSHIRQRTAASARRLTADFEARYGRRAGWYALVRALKPKIVVETGVDKGLGTCVLAAALLKNRAEGHEGRLYATDIDPTAGFLFAAPYDHMGRIVYGDSIRTLQSIREPIDLFIADSAHTAEYERGEYDTVQHRLAPQAIVVSDNAHVTQELASFAERTGRQFLYFHEHPHAHFYPGAGLGIAYQMSVSPRASSGPGIVATTELSPSQLQARHVEQVGRVQSTPLVSVLVSAYESEAFMQECLEDLEGQTIADQIEIIVVDAASPQDEGRIVKAFQQRYHNIDYIRTPNRIGVYAAWNLAIKRARGRYITPFSTNDRLNLHAYETLARMLDERPDVALVYGDTYLTGRPHQTFGQHDEIGMWRWPDYSYDYLLSHCIIGPHPMWRRSLHDTVGYFDESYIALGDQDFWIRIGARHSMLHIPFVTGLYWRSPDGLSNRMEITHPEERRLRATYRKDRVLPSPIAAGSVALPDKAETSQSIPGTQPAAAKSYRVSALVSIYDAERFVRNCLEDLLQQTIAEQVEIIVVNTASPGNEDGVIREYAARHDNIVYLKTDCKETIYGAWNRAIRAARGEYLTTANVDDRHRPDALERLAGELDSHPDVALVYADSAVTKMENATLDNAEVIGHFRWPEFDPRRLFQVCYVGPQPMWRKSLHERYGLFDAQCESAGDYEFWLRLTAGQERFQHIPDTLGLYLLSPQGNEQRNQALSIQESECARIRYWPAGWGVRPQPEGQYFTPCNNSVRRHTETGHPVVSVIVPTRDRPIMLTRAIASILAQSYQAFEILVIDDGEVSVASQVMALNHSGRIRYVWNGQRRERSFSRNEGLQLSRGKYVAYLDDDDVFYPDHLKTLVDVLEKTGSKVAYTDACRAHQKKAPDGTYVTHRHDVPYSQDFDRDLILVGNFIPICSLMHERACLDTIGLFDETLATHEDWDLLIRLSRHYTPRHIKRVTAEFSWRTDGSTTTSSCQEDFRRTRTLIFARYSPEAQRNPEILQRQREILKEESQVQTIPPFDCSIIIPVWNRVELMKQCLVALAEATSEVLYEVIVVDNGSTDDTAEFLSTLSGDVQIIRNHDNLGFARACNQGAKAARGKYLVFLNNDTIPQSGWLNALVAEAEGDASVGIVGSKLLYPDGTIQHAGVVRDCQYLLPYHLYKSFAGEHPAVNHRREFQIVTAACLLIRRSLFEEVGKFDEGYLNGLEDADLCLKVRERGYQVVYQPRSVVVHLESQTSGRKTHEAANAAHFLSRWGGQWWAGDEDRQFHVDGYKLNRMCRDGKLGGDIHLMGDIKERACWAHVAATQTAALKQDWPSVRRELALVDEWPNDRFVLAWGATVAERLQEPIYEAQFLARCVALIDEPAKRLKLIRMFLEQHNLSSAEEHLTSLLRVSPDDGEALLLKGILCMQREQYEQAEAAFSSALHQGAERRKCLMGMGMAAMGRAYTQGAWERFLEVLVEYPDDAEAIHWLLRAGTAQNRWQELGEHLHRYTAGNPEDLAARFAFTSVLLRGEQIEAARREYDALCKIDPHYDGLGQLGQAIAGREAALAMEAASS